MGVFQGVLHHPKHNRSGPMIYPNLHQFYLNEGGETSRETAFGGNSWDEVADPDRHTQSKSASTTARPKSAGRRPTGAWPSWAPSSAPPTRRNSCPRFIPGTGPGRSRRDFAHPRRSNDAKIPSTIVCRRTISRRQSESGSSPLPGGIAGNTWSVPDTGGSAGGGADRGM